MSDFFMPTQNNVDQEAEKYRNAAKSVQNQEIEEYKQKQQQHFENWDRYGVNVPDEYYDAFNKIIAQAPTPEEAQEEAYKIGSAVKYSEAMGIPLLEAYQNVDAFNEAQFTNLQDQKGRFEALSDMLNLGRNNVKLGRLGQELMQAHGNNDTELANALMAEIDAINQQNQLMQDNAPRSWVMQALEAGAQSLPFTGVVAGAGIVGNFIAPAAGTAAAFTASSYLSAGTEYIDMIANGASPETARLVATVSGGIQGLIEADLGISKSIVKSTARVIGKEAAENAAKKSVEEIGRKVFKRFHFGAGKKVLINYLENRGKDILGEGTEEFLQEITSIVGQEVAASLDGYDIPDDDFKSIVKQTTEAFRGGVLGALSMGFIPAGINAAADVREYKLIKDTAEVFESEEMFKNAAKDSPVFEGMSDEAKAETIHEVWQRAQNRKEEEANLEAQKIAEGRDAAEGAEEGPVENEDGTTEANPVARDERGRLYTSDDVSTDDAGNVTGGTFVVGDKTKSENNRYGYIKYSQDAEGNITIDNFKMTKGRDKLRAEAFDEFARQHPNVNIEWNATAPDLQDFKNELIDANPSGKKNGLNYYSTTELDNVAARKRVADELRKNIHNVKRNADGSYTQTNLNNKQIAAGVTLIESAARRMGMGLNEYINKTFGNQIFGSREEFASASLAQGEDVNKKAGGMYQGVAQANWREVGQQIKAVIYAGEHADFSTWAHEMAHVFQNQLDGQLKTDAEAAFNVQNGDWINSTYTFKDGRTMASAEAFAYGFQDWLETGKAENEQMRNIFQKFAEFIADCYNRLKSHLDFTPEIESVFNQLLDGDDTIMSKALKAAQEQDNEYRASLKRQAEEKQAAKEAAAEKAKQQAEATREEASEGTEFTEAEPTAEELLNGIEEAENETKKTTEETNAIDDALENTNLTDEQKEQIAETLKDESSTVVEKAEATTEAAESAYDDIDLFQNEGALLSQLIGEPTIRNMAESNIKTQIMSNLNTAVRMETNNRTAKQIKQATGWEKNPDGEWKYETDDSINTLNMSEIENSINTGKKLTIGKVLDADKLYEILPLIKDVNISFISAPGNFTSDIDNSGIVINTKLIDKAHKDEELRAAIAKEIQHVIQAYEYAADNPGQFYNKISEIHNNLHKVYNDMLIANKAMKLNVSFDKKSVQDSINKIYNSRGELEARNVARRVLYDFNRRKDETLASTENDKRKIIYQTIQDLLFQDELTMYGIHNLSEEALRHAVKMGGLANPSMAVVDTEKKSFTNFGEVSLIPYNYMLEKGEGSKGTFGADIYSPRYPSIDKRVTETGQKKVHAIFHAIEDENYRNQLEEKLVQKIENSSRQFDYAYSPLVIAYLAEKGNKDFYKYEKSEYSDEVKDLIKSLGASPNAMAEKDNKVILEAYSKHQKSKYEEQINELQKELEAPASMPEGMKKARLRRLEKLQEDLEIVNETIKELVDEKTGLFNGNVADDFLYRVKHEMESAGKIDYTASEYAARELIENDPEFLPWAKDAYDRIEKEERIFNGFTPSGNRRYLAHTLENVSKFMRQQELQGGEGYYGLGSTRAKFTPNFKTLNQIKKARNRLISHDEFEKIKAEYDERYNKITDAIGEKYDYDVGAARFEEAFTYGKNDPIGYLEKEYGLSIDDELAQEILDFATALRVMPTEYFETKYTRPVELNEFAGAIIPSNLSQDLKDTLAEKGLMIEEYDSEAGNREEVTKAALQKFNETRRVLFQEEQIHSDAFKNWFGDWENDPQNASKVVDENGEPLVVYHGTYSGQFDVFDKNRANPENDFGKGFYFTDNNYDVSDNYEGGGPDFENKVSRLAERIQQDNEDLSYEEAEQQARDQLYVDANLFEVYLSMKHPVYVGDNETDIVSELFDDIDVSEEDFDNEDDYYEELENARADRLEEVRQAILSSGYYGAEEAADKVMEFFYNGSGTLAELKEILNDGSIEVYDESDENYGFATNDIARIVAEALGYDGIIDTSVSEKFKNMNLDESTTHYIVFNPNQIKSATDNSGAFDPENPSILFQDEIEKTGKNMEFAVNSSYDEYANEEVKEKAEALLDTRINEDPRYNRNGTKVWSICRDLKQHKGSEIVGKKIEVDATARPTENGWNQLREILDIFRNKSFETFRYILIDETGEIKKQYAVTARMPGVTPIGEGKTTAEKISYLNKIATEAANTNCKIVFVHNHPSGNIEQSPQDEQVTGMLRQVPSLYLGNMILDHNSYNLNILSDANESVWTHHTIKGNEKDNLLKIPRKHKNVLNNKVANWTDLDVIADKLNNVDKGFIPVCFVTHATNISSIAYIPEELFTSNNIVKLRKNLEGTALKAGTCRTFAIINNPDIYDFISKNNSELRFCDVAFYSKEQSNYIHLEAGNNYDFYDTTNTEGQITVNEKVYHGSGADFDKFDTENFGLSGEGSMSFGYGVYLTDNEDIAKDYARRQAETIITLDGKEWKPDKSKLHEKIIYGNLKNGWTLEDVKKWAEGIKSADRKKVTFDTIKEFEEKGLKIEREKRKVYTVEIPDDGYLNWKDEISVEDAIKIANKFITYAERNKLDINAKKLELPEEWSYDGTITGQDLYIRLDQALYGTGTEKSVSRFLNSIGYAGIKYPAGTIHGNGNGAYNYVIFNDDDAQIVDKMLFQTNAELMDEARTFDSWQEFMDYCEAFHADDEVSPIPSDADAQWYQTFYETSNGVKTEQEKNEETVEAKNKKEGALPGAVDALFTTMIRSDPQMVDSFLQAVAELDAIDLDSEEWQQAESAEDAAQREQIEKLKDFIGITLSDYNWQTALKRIQRGHEISEGLRKRLIGEMTDSFKARDFRALYSEVMNDPQFAVAEEDSITASLNKKLKKYHDIVKPNDDISRWSPERRKQLAEQLANREIAAKIRSGSLKLDDELDAYIKSLNKQIKETQDQYNELEKETKADYQRIADKERRDLLKLHEQLLLARGKLNSRNTEINRKIAKGLKITDKYSRLTQNLNANYDELFRKYNDLRNTITINAEVQAALDRQEQVAGLREDLNAKQKEKNLTAEVKKMRIQLVKRTMRRVPFNRVDYNNARTVIAIQRMLEPNLLGGVNRFIGIDSPYLRGVISQIVTDSDYKEKILNYLSKNSKASQAFADFKKKLTELKSIKDFDSWTAKDRKAAIRYLPKENWVKDLNLLQLAKEREESIDLDIGMEEIKRTVYDEKTGEPKTYKDKEGNEHNVTETAFKLKANEEIERLVQDAVGADMFDKIVNMPFSEWTTEDLETLAQRIDELYTEGRDLKAAKDEARKKEAAAIRKRIEDAIKETGITINDDDTPEEKERKQKQIDKILGMSDDLKGTEAAKPKGFKAKITRLLHSYADMNVLRFARMLDGQSEGENVRMLYRKEDDCYNVKQRSMNARAEKIYKVMQENGITEGDLAETVEFNTIGSKTEFTVDELLYFLAADKDYAEDEKLLAKGEIGLDANDDYAATSRNAVMFGNMMSDMMSQEEKESWLQLDKDMEEALQNDTLTQEQKEQLATGQLDKKPGTTRYIAACHAKWGAILGLANSFLNQNPKYKALMEAIEADYAEQYDRMNEVSINEFNMPVHRVKAYVPLVRRESNGDTNENQVKEDLLGAAGVGKQWADRGMTQRRVQISPLNQKPVQTGLFRTWGDSIERTEHFIAYAPYVRQLNAIYKSRDASYTRRFIESRYGTGAIKYLDEYINEVANPNAGRIRERGAEWLHILRGKTAPAYLGWKASAIIKQGLTSPWPYMQFINPAEYVAAAMKFTFNPEMREAIKEKSVFMKMRRMDPVNDLIDEMADSAKTKLDRGWSNFSKIGMQGLEMIDWACVAPGWLACYEKKYNQLQNASNARYEAKMAELKERNMYADVGTSEYLTPQQMEAEAKKEMLEDIEAEAVRYADDCTRQCQPSNRVTDLAPMFKNSSEAMKAFLQFQTSLNVIWQNLRYDMPYAVKNKEFTRIAGTVIGYVCAGIFMNSVMEGIGGDDDDDETQALRNLIYYSTTQFTDSIPIMGSEITNTMDQLITGKRGFYGSGTDMTPSATKLLSVLTNAKKGNWQKAAELTAEGIGLYLGAPVSGAKEINKLLGKPLSEGDVNLKRGISDVYGIAGDILEE